MHLRKARIKQTMSINQAKKSPNKKANEKPIENYDGEMLAMMGVDQVMKMTKRMTKIGFSAIVVTSGDFYQTQLVRKVYLNGGTVN